MFESEILNLIYSKMSDEFHLPYNEMKIIYDNEIKKIQLFSMSQDIPYKIANLVNCKKCELKSSQWLNILFDNGIEPRINTSNKKYGDLGACDGNYNILIDKYKVIITVKSNNHFDKCKFIFQFNENNDISIKCFFDLFQEYIKERYNKILIYQRLNEITNNELNEIKKIHNKKIIEANK